MHSGIDEVTFSIDGASQETYVRYRQRGKFDKAIANLRAMADEKARSGRDVPQLNWRYILFKWNDSDEEMERARALAEEIGVDRLCWEITDHPEDSFSRRFAPGSPDLERIRHEIWDNNNLGNAIPGATPRAQIDVRHWLPGLPRQRRASEPLRDRRTSATCRRGRFARRRATAGGWCGSARSCSTIAASMLNRDYARAWLPGDIAARRQRRRADRDADAGRAGPLHAQVRSRQRGDRLVRGVRLGDDIRDAGRSLRPRRPA